MNVVLYVFAEVKSKPRFKKTQLGNGGHVGSCLATPERSMVRTNYKPPPDGDFTLLQSDLASEYYH